MLEGSRWDPVTSDVLWFVCSYVCTSGLLILRHEICIHTAHIRAFSSHQKHTLRTQLAEHSDTLKITLLFSSGLYCVNPPDYKSNLKKMSPFQLRF